MCVEHVHTVYLLVIVRRADYNSPMIRFRSPLLPQFLLYSGLVSLSLLNSCDQETRDGLKRQAGGLLEDQVKTNFDEEINSIKSIPERVKAMSEGLSGQEIYEQALALLKPDVDQPGSHDETIIGLIRRSAEEGYAKAQVDLAGLYLEGAKGVEKNKQLALEWFQKAAEQGNQAARYYAADLLYRGEGVVQDKAKAVKEWRIAAEAGLPEAQYRFSKFLLSGDAITEQGRKYLETAAEAGHAMAARDLGFLHARGEKGLPFDMKKSAYWYEKAAQAGDAEALYISALFYIDGKLMPEDVNKAVRYLKMAAGQDHVPSLELLISILAQHDSELDQREVLAWEERLKQIKAQKAQQQSK